MSDSELYKLVKDSAPVVTDSQAAERLLREFPTNHTRRPGSWTSLEASTLWGVSRAAASERCRKLVKDKKAGVDTILIAGHPTQVYYWLEVENDKS